MCMEFCVPVSNTIPVSIVYNSSIESCTTRKCSIVVQKSPYLHDRWWIGNS